MNRKFIRGRMGKLGLALVAVIAVIGGTARASGLGWSGSTKVPPGPNDPRVLQCLAQGRHVCIPETWQKMSAHNPFAHPPSNHPTYISRDSALDFARRFAATSLTPMAPANSTMFAQLMTRVRYESLDTAAGQNFVPDRRRLVWVVTVHANIATSWTLVHRPQIKHVYTVAIDAESGWITDACIGCATLTSN